MVVCFLTVPKEYTEPRENELDHSLLTELKVHLRYLQIFQICVRLDLLFIYGPDVSISQIPDNSGKLLVKKLPFET